MSVEESRRRKRERLRAGIALVLEKRWDRASEETRDELARFLLREHQLPRVLGLRYADCTRTALDGFPDGDLPPDVLESHVDALAVHDETYALRLFHSDELVVRALRGTATTVRRAYQWLDEGDRFTLAGRRFKVAQVARERTGDVTDEGARREGMTSLAEWRLHWIDNLPRSAGGESWSPDQTCVRHDFAPDDAIS